MKSILTLTLLLSATVSTFASTNASPTRSTYVARGNPHILPIQTSANLKTSRAVRPSRENTRAHFPMRHNPHINTGA